MHDSKKHTFIATLVSISTKENNTTKTGVGSAPIPIFAEVFHLITGLTGEGHQLFRPTALYSLCNTHSFNRFLLSNSQFSLFDLPRDSLISKNDVCRSICLFSDRDVTVPV